MMTGTTASVDLVNKRIEIDGTPRLLISGEVHYFRLDRTDWDDRLRRLKKAGANTVASYIPWLMHERPDGTFDLDGHTEPNLDLGAFIDLAAEHGLFFMARPGPFIMAEMKNEGLPYRLYTEHPEIVPVGWDGKPAPTRTVDYLAPAFLQEVHHWYEAVMPVIVPRLHANGGNTIAVQLDNEVGMLSWVSISPDLTDGVLRDFRAWLGDGASAYHFGDADDAAFAQGVRSPESAYAGILMRDLGHFMRHRFARYIATLRTYAEEMGVRDVPFIVNVHGTEAGGGASFPIGISQLYESYTQAPGYLAGSDHYLGDLTSRNAPDWYVMNAMMEAVNRPEQPLSSVEFEAGSGDYGQSLGARLDPSAADFKLRMAVAQGNRLINYYLFTGGINPPLPEPVGDGDDLVSFTGQRHGIGAPIGPEGQESYTLPRLARTNRMLLAHEASLATANEERDDIALAFIPDAFMTESVYRGNGVMPEIADNLRRTRFGGPGETTIRVLQQLCYRYTAIDIQNRTASLDPARVPVLVVNPARYMATDVQQTLVDYLHAGGRVLLHGELPQADMTGAPSTVLIDALGLDIVGERERTHRFYPTAVPEGWAAGGPTLPISWVQRLRPHEEGTFLRIHGEEEACGLEVQVGAGRAIVLSCALPADLHLFREALSRLGTNPGLDYDHPERNIVLTSAQNDWGERFIHALNLDGFDKTFHIRDQGAPLFGGHPVTLKARDGVMLPMNLGLEPVGARLLWSTAEVLDRVQNGLVLRIAADIEELAMVLPDGRHLAPQDGLKVSTEAGQTRIRIEAREIPGTEVRLRWDETSSRSATG